LDQNKPQITVRKTSAQTCRQIYRAPYKQTPKMACSMPFREDGFECVILLPPDLDQNKPDITVRKNPAQTCR